MKRYLVGLVIFCFSLSAFSEQKHPPTGGGGGSAHVAVPHISAPRASAPHFTPHVSAAPHVSSGHRTIVPHVSSRTGSVRYHDASHWNRLRSGEQQALVQSEGREGWREHRRHKGERERFVTPNSSFSPYYPDYYDYDSDNFWSDYLLYGLLPYYFDSALSTGDVYYDANGNPYYLDASGNPYYLDANGNPYYLDANGNPYYPGS